MNKILILNAAARCMAPDQYEKFESLISTGDLGERFSRCISKVVIADTAGAKPRESLQLTCEQAIRLNAALESPSEPNEALKGAMEKFRAQESRERVSMTYEQFTELASKAKASNDLHMRVLALEASSYLKDEEISHLRKRIAATPAPSVADAAGASEDARDAARWRHLRNCGVIVDFTHAGPWKFTDDADAAVDKLIARSAAINAASASKTTERKKLCTGSHIMCEGREYCLGHPSCSELAAKESGND